MIYKIYLFGTPRLSKNGELVKIKRRKSLAILAYLAVSNQPYSRDELATLLYPGHDQAGARGNLRRDIFELKASLEDGILLLGGEQISLMNSEQLWVDVNEFLGQVNYVHQHHPSKAGNKGDAVCTDCIDRYIKAIELYSADFMSGFTITGSRQFEDWQFFQSENLRQFLAEILQQLIQWHSGRGEFEPAMSYGRRWLALDPLHEPAQRQVMRLYAMSGQHAAALRQFIEFDHQLQVELGSSPDEETYALYESIRDHRVDFETPIIPEKPTHFPGRHLPNLSHNNLPLPDETLIGRKSELELILQKLRNDPDCRMLTLVGPGGVGKTRLAVESALRLAEDPDCPFCEGIFYISLAELSNADAITQAIAEVLKVPLLPDSEQRVKQVLYYLQTKRVLLLLDNFEHLIVPKNIQILVDILTHSPQVKLLITSQTRLNTHAEYVVPLHGLEVPKFQSEFHHVSMETDIAEFSAIQLFLTRAKHVNPDFIITEGNFESIIRICQVLEGMPLGIEMSVAWLDMLSPAEILKEINDCLDFLEVNWLDKPERHRSLRAVFDGSWKLLTEQERSVLMGLTVFPSNFSRRAAEAISDASLVSLMSLNNKSWLKVLNDGYYQIHEQLRLYANEKLQADPNAWRQVMDRYCVYYVDFLEIQAENIKGSGQRDAYEAIIDQFENIQLAWQWLIQAGQIEKAIDCMLPALFRYAETHVKPFELTQLLDLAHETLEQGPTSSSYIRLEAIIQINRAAFNVFGFPLRMGYPIGNLAQEKAALQAWQFSGEVDSLKSLGFWGVLLAYLYGLLVDAQVSMQSLHNLISYIREERSRWDLAYALYLLGSVIVLNYRLFTMTITRPAEAEPFLKEALSIFQELNDKSESGHVLEIIGMLNVIEGKYQKAIDLFKEALECSDMVGEWVTNASIFWNISDAYRRLGEHGASFLYMQLLSQRFLNLGHLSGVAHALSNLAMSALRFGEIEYARQTRQECLSFYQQDGNDFGVAWATWEMSEVFRMSGDLDQAQEWLEKARLLFEKFDDPSIDIFLERSQADMDFLNGYYNQAKLHFEKSAFQARHITHKWALSYALCGLGRAEIELGEIGSAHQHFLQAVQAAREIDDYDLVLNPLAGFTKILILTAAPEKAVELGSWIIHHHQCWNETKDRVRSLLNSISLPPGRLVEARERSEQLDFTKAITWITNFPGP